MRWSLHAKGLTTGEISAHFAEIYGASVSRETISRITDKVIEEMNDWSVRPLDEIYAAIFIDAIVVKVRDRQVANRPFYAVIGVTLTGKRDILGLWAGGPRTRRASSGRTRRTRRSCGGTPRAHRPGTPDARSAGGTLPCRKRRTLSSHARCSSSGSKSTTATLAGER